MYDEDQQLRQELLVKDSVALALGANFEQTSGELMQFLVFLSRCHGRVPVDFASTDYE